MARQLYLSLLKSDWEWTIKDYVISFRHSLVRFFLVYIPRGIVTVSLWWTVSVCKHERGQRTTSTCSTTTTGGTVQISRDSIICNTTKIERYSEVNCQPWWPMHGTCKICRTLSSRISSLTHHVIVVPWFLTSFACLGERISLSIRLSVKFVISSTAVVPNLFLIFMVVSLTAVVASYSYSRVALVSSISSAFGIPILLAPLCGFWCFRFYIIEICFGDSCCNISFFR